jgi:SAM-dependent methyltransferase
LNAPRVFDRQHYDRLNRARGDVVRRLLAELAAPMNLKTAVDVGCGAGYFSGLLQSLGLQVTAADGRKENAEEAARRVPGVVFHTLNAEDPKLRSLGTFDLVFCFGLLYHLENPFLAIQHLHAMSKSLLLAEGLVYPGEEPIMGLLDESPYEDQGLRHVAFYPTEACLIKMMYRAGFGSVYRLAEPPDHIEYKDAATQPRNRTVLAASVAPVLSTQLIAVSEPTSSVTPWERDPERSDPPVSRLRRFVEKPLPQKVETIKRLVRGK